MNKYVILSIASIMACAAIACNNQSKKASQGNTKELVEFEKVSLSEEALMTIDKIGQAYLDSASSEFPLIITLTDEEKALKPDYLMDPSSIDTLITKSQKVNALAYLCVERIVREIYDMPLDEANAAIAKLLMDLGYSVDKEDIKTNPLLSEEVRKQYDIAKKKNELSYFWQFQCAVTFHTDYIIACNPRLYIPKYTENVLMVFNNKIQYVKKATGALAPYDKEMAMLSETIAKWDLLEEKSYWDTAFENESATIQFYLAYKNAIFERRNAMLR